MKTKTVTVKNSVGLHARPATFFIQKANNYDNATSIWIKKNEKKVNAKSLLGVLSLCVTPGTVIEIIADGKDENQAVEELSELIESNFEDEKDHDNSYSEI